jgi:hypothetical protein
LQVAESVTNQTAYRLHNDRSLLFSTNSGDLKNMRNIIRTALIVGTLATPMITMADTPAKKDAPAKTDAKKDAKAGDMKDAPKADAKAGDMKDAPKADAKKDTKAGDMKDAPKTDAKTDAKKDTKKDVKAPATK